MIFMAMLNYFLPLSEIISIFFRLISPLKPIIWIQYTYIYNIWLNKYLKEMNNKYTREQNYSILQYPAQEPDSPCPPPSPPATLILLLAIDIYSQEIHNSRVTTLNKKGRYEYFDDSKNVAKSLNSTFSTRSYKKKKNHTTWTLNIIIRDMPL